VPNDENLFWGIKNAEKDFFNEISTRRPIFTIDIAFYLKTRPFSEPKVPIDQIDFRGHKTAKKFKRGFFDKILARRPIFTIDIAFHSGTRPLS
jgi:hypothetical protein